MKLLACLLALCVIITLAGCGGGGGGATTLAAAPPTSNPANAPMTGDWSGNWTNDHGESGTLFISVATNGRITGSATNLIGNAPPIIASGNINSSGNYFVSCIQTQEVFRAEGALIRDETTSHLTGTLDEYWHGVKVGVATVDLSPDN